MTGLSKTVNVQYEKCSSNHVDYFNYTELGSEEFYEYINFAGIYQRQVQKIALFLYNVCDTRLKEVYSDECVLHLYLVLDYD